MANDKHVALLKQDVEAWNAWRRENPNVPPDLSEADLNGAILSMAWLTEAAVSDADLHRAILRSGDFSEADLIEIEADLHRADLSRTSLNGANLIRANLIEANLRQAKLSDANLSGANLSEAHLFMANLSEANLSEANLSGANLSGADLSGADLSGTDLSGANLRGAVFSREADLSGATLSGADLSGVSLMRANLSMTNLSGANLSGANLDGATMVETDLTGADLTGCRIYGVSAWGLKLERANQRNLVITPPGEPEIAVDNVEVAQFIYLLLRNEKIRDVIDTIGKKGVLLLGRFTEGRMVVLERLREKLRDLGFVPMVFNFDKPETKDFTETVRLLASLSKFVIVDLTTPRSAPLELQATVPQCKVPFAPIIPFSMFVDLQNAHDWVLRPVISYPSVDRLIEVLKDQIVIPAEAKFDELLGRRTNQLRTKKV